MKVTITGAAGLVGRRLVTAFGTTDRVCGLTHADLDITDADAVAQWCRNERPDVVINCAVLGVDACERDPQRAYDVNVAGPRLLTAAADAIGARFVHYSSNYVFDGRLQPPALYTIRDTPLALNVYGRTKLDGEVAVQAAAPRCFIIRSSWVYGSGKASFLSTVAHDLRAGRRVRAIADVWASTTYVADLAARTIEILRHGRYGVYQVVNAGVCSYHEFALEAARLVGVGEADARRLIESRRVADAGWAAERPRYSPMRCLLSEEQELAPLRDWRSALAAYVHSQRDATPQA